MDKADQSKITQVSIKGLETLQRLLESDPEIIASMPLEEIEAELRLLNLDPEDTDEQIQKLKDRLRHPTTYEHSSQETINRMRSLSQRSTKLREILRVIGKTGPR